ncbi:MAG: sigma-70 family RNA polymerase sigma factor [Spirochaetes bacterium]|nr:sigma-70 family RNA polymerase sigma factor [Spirochaetota bacterium]MBP8991621.1 sigma-70 family RNA polymerase sigma factor [Spirochaetota bacterium]NLJ06004.1 sigma-70 family RNA polymerase sigma factor [Exilispira sp.]
MFARYDLYIFKLVFSFATRISLLAEIDDLKAEANIAFLDAVKSFDPEMNVNFSVYLRCIVRNRLLTYVKLRNKASSEQIESFTNIIESEVDSFKENYDVLAFEPIIMNKIKKIIQNLSDFERKVFLQYIDLVKVSEIANILGLNKKSVENAIYRVKTKFVNEFDEEEILIMTSITNFKEKIKIIMDSLT